MKKEHACRRGTFWGIAFIIVGIIFMLNALGALSAGWLSWYPMFWPVLLIFSGAGFLLGYRPVGQIFLALTLVLGVAFLVSSYGDSTGEHHFLEQRLEKDVHVNTLQTSLSYGGGDISIKAGDGSYLLLNSIETTDRQEPEFTYEVRDGVAKLDISRSFDHAFWYRSYDRWDISLSPGVSQIIDLDFGASDLDIDLRGLDVPSLELDSGAADMSIVFGQSPTQTEIDTGASSLEMEFPDNKPVKVFVDAGATSIDLDGFEKIDDVYYSPGFVDEDAIVVEISAGASSISGTWYHYVKPEPEGPSIKLDIVPSNETVNNSQDI